MSIIVHSEKAYGATSECSGLLLHSGPTISRKTSTTYLGTIVGQNLPNEP